MKKVLFLLFLLNCNTSLFSQERKFPIDSLGNIEYKEIVNCNLTAREIFTNAKNWIINKFGDYDKILIYEELSNNKFAIKGNICIRSVNIANEAYKYFFTLIIEAKNGKYKYTINNFSLIKILEPAEEFIKMGILSADGPNQITKLSKIYWNDEIKGWGGKLNNDSTRLNSLNKILENADNLKIKKNDYKEYIKESTTLEKSIIEDKDYIIKDKKEYAFQVKSIELLIDDMKKNIFQKNDF